MKKILLAGPGTGKTTKVKEDFLSNIENFNNVLVLSFTNATVNDLRESFEKSGIPIDAHNCMTLHSYALKINHEYNLHILNNLEEKVIKKYAKTLKIDFDIFCEMIDSITYGQMITKFLSFAKTNPVYLKEKIGNIDLLIIDEFQDFNDMEQELVHLISECAKETLILGDDDQCIYGFKDATSVGIVALHNDPKIENLDHENICYRCPDIIVEKCKNLLAKNKERVSKDWHPSGIEGNLFFEQKLTLSETVDYIVSEIEKIRDVDSEAPVLVLSPVRFGIDELPEALEQKSISSVNFFTSNIDLEEYKKIWFLKIIYTKYKILNLILSVEFSDLNTYRKRKFKKVLETHSKKNFSLGEMFDDITEFLSTEIASAIKNPPDFEELLQLESWGSLEEIISEIDAETPEQKLEKIDRYINIPTTFDPNSVNIMSIFKSKGLQAPYVFIVGLVDGILPRLTKGIEEIEEQRRLLFVGMTRSQKNLHLISTVRWDGKYVHQLGKEKFAQVRTGSRQYNAKTSPFIGELDL